MFKRVLVVNVNWLGDAIFSLPVFCNLKAFCPDVHISCLAVPRVVPVLKHCPQIDDIIVYDEKGKDRGLLPKVRLIRRLRAARFDAAFLLHRSVSRAWLVRLAGVPVRAGDTAKRRRWLLTHPVPPAPETMHRSDAYLHILSGCQIDAPLREAALELPPSLTAEGDRYLQTQGVDPSARVIVLNPGGNWLLKRWPVEKWRQLAVAVRQAGLGTVVITGSAADQQLSRLIQQGMDAGVVDLAGKTTLDQMLAVLNRAACVVSADSGPLHLANALGTAVVGIFGPTRPEITGPRGTGKTLTLQEEVGCNLAPCYYLDCPDNICMKAVGFQQVLSAVKALVAEG